MIRRFLREFMAGRYGFDRLNFFLILLGFVISILFSVIRIFFGRLIYTSQGAYTAYAVLSYISYIPYLIAVFRALSRNLEKRRREETAFMSIADSWISFFTKKLRQYKDKEHRYFSCPTCHRTLRVPKNRGRIKIDCPHCGRQFFKRT